MKNNTSDRRRGKAEREAESLVSGLLNSPRVVLNLTTHPRRVPLLANATSQLVYSEVTSLFRADKHCMSDKKKTHKCSCRQIQDSKWLSSRAQWKHVSLYKEILPLLSAECQQYKNYDLM